MCLQAVGRCAGADLVAHFGRDEALAAGAFRFLGGGDGGTRGLRCVIGTQRVEKHGLHGGVERVRGGAQQLARVFEIGRACAKVVEQPGERERGAVLRARISAARATASADASVEIRQEIRLRYADLCSLDARVGPGFACSRVGAKRAVDDFEHAVACCFHWRARDKTRFRLEREARWCWRDGFRSERIG